jgi:hypothetical protein
VSTPAPTRGANSVHVAAI